jgi:hypothetical protein
MAARNRLRHTRGEGDPRSECVTNASRMHHELLARVAVCKQSGCMPLSVVE